MPNYSWVCTSHHWLVTTSIAARLEPQTCPKCGEPGRKAPEMDAPNIDKTAAGSWNQQSYNPGLGCWTHSTKHAEQIAKSRGLEPIGNESVETQQKIMERTHKQNREQRWADAESEKLYD
jgi:hypothetical protein